MDKIKFFILILLAFSSSLSAQEFSYVKENSSTTSYSRYLSQLGIPRVALQRQCTKNKKTCWMTVINQNGNKIKTFSSSDSVSSQASGRYNKVAYLLVSRSYRCGDKTCTQKLLINNKGSINDIGDVPWKKKPLATRIGKNKTLYALSHSAIITQLIGRTASILNSPETILSGEIGYNTDGTISAICIADSGKIYWTDGQQWKQLTTSLAAHGDRIGVAAIYPKNNNTQYIAIYRYINEYNKGLYSLRYDSTSEKEVGGWLFNSEDRNIGFDPVIYIKKNGSIVINAADSSNEKDVSFDLNDKDFSKLSPKLPGYITDNGFEEEKFASFMLGSGISQLSWVANSKVKQDETVYLNIDYQIANTLYTSVNLEGRIGNTTLTLQYLQNQSEDLLADEINSNSSASNPGLSKAASSYLFSTFDVQGLLSPSTSLRIQAEIGETKGVAFIDAQNGSISSQEFATKMTRIAVLAMKERGYFFGADAISYAIPSAIGFSDSSKSIIYSGFDSAFGFTALRAIIGYDALAYSKRYETDYSRFYWSGSGNLGLGLAKISAETEQAALASSSATSIDSTPLYVTAGLDVELGYLWQQRFKQVRGLGYSFGLGYRANYSYLGAGQSKDSVPESDKLYMEFDRKDLLHGPFLKVNIIF